MVSFECDACNETIKKPKLQNHWNSCRAKVVCIDCSTEFYTPAEFKSHTSCISEAEKYQKGLYRGPKANGQNGNQRQNGYNKESQPHQQQSHTRPAPTAQTGKYQSWSSGNPRNSQQQWGRGFNQPRYVGTGANDTPLGTPTRMSPFTTPPAGEDVSVKEKASAAVNGDAGAKAVGEQGKKSKDKKDKKRKAEVETTAPSADEPAKKKAKSSPAPEEAPVPSTSSPEKSDKKSKKDKKEKKEKKEKVAEAEVSAEVQATTSEVEGKEKRSKSKKEKKSKEAGAIEGEAVPETNGEVEPKEKKEKKEKKSKKVKEGVAVVDASEVAEDGEKKKKKSKSKGESTAEATESKHKEKKDKKHKKSKSEAVEAS